MGIWDQLKRGFIENTDELDPSQNPVRSALSVPENTESGPFAKPEQRAEFTEQLKNILQKGPEFEQYPTELVPKTGVKEALKRGLLNRIPFVGPELESARKMNQLAAYEDWKQKNESIKESWRRQEALLTPLLKEQIDNDMFTNRVQNKYIYYMKNFVSTGVWTQEQAAYAASGVPMPKHLQAASETPMRFHIAGTPPEQLVVGTFVPRDGKLGAHGKYMNPVDGSPAIGIIGKDIDRVMPMEPAREPQSKTPHYYTGEDGFLHMVDPVTQEDSIVKGARPRIPPDTTGRFETTRADSSYNRHVTLLDKLQTPLDATVGRLSRLEDTLKANNPQADALVAPELLTVMAGGQGSGLRMTEAEIARIVKGRSNFESLKAALNKWQSDPSKALSITPAQRGQIWDLVREIGSKLRMKQGLLQQANESLLASEQPEHHRRVYADLKIAMSDIDSGKVKYIQGENGAWVKYILEGEKWVKAKSKVQ